MNIGFIKFIYNSDFGIGGKVMDTLSYEITQQVIQCFGLCFHYKHNMEQFLLSCNVPKSIIEKHKVKNKAKFTWARDIMFELSSKEQHILTQKRIVTELCKLKDIHDNGVNDKNKAMDTLRKLRIIAKEYDKSLSNKTLNTKTTPKEKVPSKSMELEKLNKLFKQNMLLKNRQEAGFHLELILQNLFELNQIKYDCSFRTDSNTQQIDGHFHYEGFDYLVESKWTQNKSSSSDIASFKRKIDTKISSTRGLFISVNGFRDEIIQEYSGEGAKIIFMDGSELVCVLEGIIDLKEVLDKKIVDSVKYGRVYSKIY